jgi:hypothetical protein
MLQLELRNCRLQQNLLSGYVRKCLPDRLSVVTRELGIVGEPIPKGFEMLCKNLKVVGKNYWGILTSVNPGQTV